jgi:hypothetical protein
VGKWLMVEIGCDWHTELDMFSHDCDMSPQSHLLLANHIVKHDVLCEYLKICMEKSPILLKREATLKYIDWQPITYVLAVFRPTENTVVPS